MTALMAAKLVRKYSPSKYLNTTAYPYPFRVPNDAALDLADNVRKLMDAENFSQTDLARKAEIAQKTVSDLLGYGRTQQKAPTLRTIEAIARALQVPVWVLLIPDLPLELLRSAQFANLVLDYRAATASGRDSIERIARGEARYADIAKAEARKPTP